MMRNVLAIAIATAMGCAVAQGAAVSLAGDFSIANGNPNGQWSYTDGSTLLSLQVPVNNGNAFRPAVSNGYWGLGNDLNTNTPDLAKAQVNGSAAGETDLDFLAGDVVGHSPNDGSFLFQSWTAPSDGTISNLDLLVWYAHSAVSRSSDFVLRDNALTLALGTVSNSLFFDRAHAASYSNAGFGVTAGDVISLGLAKSAGQQFGSIAGLSLDFTFTEAAAATPEPATLALSGMALGVLALAARRRISVT